MGKEKLKYESAYIYVGGEADPALLPRPSGDELLIAADSGYFLARECGVLPKILLGDMDSLEERDRDAVKKIPPEVEVIRVPAEKDETDTMLAADMALEAGCRDICILGGLGGRFDHSLANLYLLEYLFRRGAAGVLTDGRNRVRYLQNGKMRVFPSDHRYFSVIAATDARGVYIEGAKYPLRDAVINRERQYAVSNELGENSEYAEITVSEGSVFIIESR